MEVRRVRADSRAGKGSTGGVGGLGSLDVPFFDPGHEGAEAGTDFFDRVFGSFFEEGVVIFASGFVFGDPAAGEFPGLDFLEGLLHAGLDGGVNDFWSDGHIAVFGSL